MGVPVLRLIAFAMPALASTMIFTAALRGAGDTRVPVLFTWVGFLAFRIPLAYLLTGPAQSRPARRLARDDGRPVRPRGVFPVAVRRRANGNSLGFESRINRGRMREQPAVLCASAVISSGPKPLSALQLGLQLVDGHPLHRGIAVARQRRGNAARLPQDHVHRLHADRAVGDVRRRAAHRHQQVACIPPLSASGCDTESRTADTETWKSPSFRAEPSARATRWHVVRVGVVGAEADRVRLCAVGPGNRPAS